jgi:enterochelin esterase family protein
MRKSTIKFFVIAFALLFIPELQAQISGRQKICPEFRLPPKVYKPVLEPLPSGTYSIGAGGYFSSIQEAFNKLSIDGISGSITLELIDNLYTAPTDSFGFHLKGPIPGAGQDNRVTIKPAENKNVTIQGSGFAVLVLNNVSFIAFDGVSCTGNTTLKIHAKLNNQFPWNTCLDFWNDSDNNSVQNITFLCDDVNKYGSGTAFWTTLSNSGAPDSNLIQNNFIQKAGTGIYVSGFNSPLRAIGNIIVNNFIGSETDSLFSWGIQIEKCKNTIVEYNTIQNQRARIIYSDFNFGINSYWGDGDIIRNNTIYNFKSTVKFTCTGILLSGDSGKEGNYNVVYNNMIYDLHNSSPTASVAGIHMFHQNTPSIYFNSIYLSGKGGINQDGSAAIHIGNNCFDVNIKNNILVNTRDESPQVASALRIDDTLLKDVLSNYNILFCQPIQYNHLVITHFGGDFKQLNEWQLTGKDLDSYSFIPAFTDEKLHIDAAIPTWLESTGFPIPSINYDIDGDLRHPSAPDIGADEFNGIKMQDALSINPAQIDFGNIKPNQLSDTISVVIKNLSPELIILNSFNDTLTSFKLMDLPLLPMPLLTNDSVMFKVYFQPSSYGEFNGKILITSSYSVKPTYSISLKGNVPILGSIFQMFYDRVNNAPNGVEKTAIVDSFLNANPILPFVEDSIAHFIYYGEANAISVPCDANDFLETVWPMYRVSGTSLWFRSQVFEMDARIDYKFENNFNLFLDPRNPRVCPNAFGGNSELVMPNYVDALEIEYYPDIPHGLLVDTIITSISLGNSRTIKIYLPPGYDSQAGETYGVVLFHDGLDFINFAKVNNILDYLINKKQIQPLIGVFVPPVEREAEYAENKTEQYENFILNELMPYIDNKYRTKKEPDHRAMFGISYGGLITTQICYNHPESFGLAGPYSASYKVNSMKVFSSVENGPKKNIKWYLDCGTYEPTILRTLSELRDTLLIKGYEVNWRQWHEGHSWGSWRAHLDIALEYFFPGDSVTVQVNYDQLVPTYYFLYQNYPNPFNPSTRISWQSPVGGHQTLKIFDVLGNEIVTLVDEYKPSGKYEVDFHASKLSSGVYFYQLKADSFIMTRKAVFLR